MPGSPQRMTAREIALAVAAAKLEEARQRAFCETALQYSALPIAARLEILIYCAIELTVWADAALAGIAAAIEESPRRGETVH